MKAEAVPFEVQLALGPCKVDAIAMTIEVDPVLLRRTWQAGAIDDSHDAGFERALPRVVAGNAISEQTPQRLQRATGSRADSPNPLSELLQIDLPFTKEVIEKVTQLAMRQRAAEVDQCSSRTRTRNPVADGHVIRLDVP